MKRRPGGPPHRAFALLGLSCRPEAGSSDPRETHSVTETGRAKSPRSVPPCLTQGVMQAAPQQEGQPMTTIDDRAVSAFRENLAGSVLSPADDGYDEARRVFNGEIDRHPALIVRCAGPHDVAAALGYARDHGLEITVRGGGHNLGGAAVADGALMIDLSTLRTVTVDAGARTARAGGGATNADL